MLVKEHQILQQCKHKNILKSIEIYQDPNQLVYIMEYLSGGELYARLKLQKRFTEEIAIQLMYNITRGIYYLHKKKIVHRDIKLENIIFINKAQLDLKVIDFGFAQNINYQKLDSKAGTPGFLPPELFKNLPYTEKGDVFSLGVILYCLVSGQSPFKGKLYKEVLENNRRCKISFESSIWNKISDDCKFLIKKMLEYDPKKRYSCKDVLMSRWMRKITSKIPTKNRRRFQQKYNQLIKFLIFGYQYEYYDKSLKQLYDQISLLMQKLTKIYKKFKKLLFTQKYQE
ncbi:protein kinase domain protein [Ichthyophthirius multifiliis]|uniref:Protein kinase domain protein n=1 Tax=Ichthyophthirius multifiliis TaxID=5932 RepID=G0QKN2_ICHMU|nr:protein kinase domain protein [Ichthyophthirius multifiliis]EGR34230.1 protein kinase domain protein [Ichthyophthirius multifiliis]|eukprot:XP_004039534.1 protein kinase domain protein [Ichthyophthirius multifiliis]